MSEPRTLERLLERLHGRITRLVWIHGLSTVVGSAAVILVVAFLLDWGLHVPRGVRWIHLAALLAIPVYLAVRELLRPLRARPDRTARAVLLERAYPDLREVLVTAAELDARATNENAAPNPDRRDLRARIRAEAEARAAAIDPGRALDPRPPRLRFLLGTLASVACAGLLIANPAAAGVFFERLFLGNTPWPQRTHLSIEIPIAGAGRVSPADLAAPGMPLTIRVARGTDVPVVVHAEGAVPDEVTLHLSGGHRAVLAASGGPVFRTLLRSVQEDTDLFATGGDDEDEDPTVRLLVLRPPDLAGLALAVEPPAYSGLAPEIVVGGDAEVLAGSRIVVHVLPDPEDASGKARLLPEDRVIDLAPGVFPAPPGLASGSAPGSDGAAATSPEARRGLAFELQPEKSLRYRIELVDRTGLQNPDPGLFAISVVEDRAPDVEILSPGRGDYDTVAGGMIALRVRAKDDFGISKLTYTSSIASGAASSASTTRELKPPFRKDAGKNARRR
jgi:hypothetical protein